MTWTSPRRSIGFSVLAAAQVQYRVYRHAFGIVWATMIVQR